MEYIYKVWKKDIWLVDLDYWVGNIVAEEFYKKHKFVKYKEYVYKKV